MKKCKIILGLFIIWGAVLILFPERSVFASSFKYKNYSTGKTVSYSGTIPSYVINGQKADLSSEPALISDRCIAYVSANGLFRDVIGMSVSYSKSNKCIRFSYRGHVLKMYVGKVKAYFDGVKIEAPCAPMRIKYKKSGIIANLVPSRFVTESFGLYYEWDNDSDTVSIEIPTTIKINGVETVYEDTKGKIKFEGKTINQKGTYSLVLSSIAMINADCGILKKAGIKYKYNAKKGLITLSYNGNEIRYCLNSRISYINGILTRNPYSPILVYFPDLDKEFVYIPGRFTFENLGFYYNWNEKTDCSEIKKQDPDLITEEDNETEIPKGDPGHEEPERGDSIDEDEKKGIELIRIVNTDKGYKFFLDKDNCAQELTLKLDMIKNVKKIDIRENILDCMNELVIKGDYSEYFKDAEIVNTGEAVLQIRIYYDHDADETLIRMYSDMVLGCEPVKIKKGVFKFNFDYIKNLYDKVIVLDAGHGGHDCGAVSVSGEYHESDLNLKIILNCRELFKDTDIKVFYTRLDDTFISLYDRAAYAEMVGADMFISVHHNLSESPGPNGTSIHCSEKNTCTSLDGLTSEKLAWKLLYSLLDYLETKMFSDGVIKQNFVVIRDSKAPAVLLEIGFISNKKELKRLVSDKFSKKVAQCIVDNVLDIYGENTGKPDTGDNDNKTEDEEKNSNENENKNENEDGKEEIVPVG